MSRDVGLEIAQLISALRMRSQPTDRVSNHLLVLDMHELYEFAARNPDKVNVE